MAHRLRFTEDLFNPRNLTLRTILEGSPGSSGRAVVVIDEGVMNAAGDLVPKLGGYASAHADVLNVVRPPLVVPGGEAAKNDWGVYQRVMDEIERGGICRHSYVIVIGGGAVLDAAGFAAATGHRGVRLIRVPTTTLAQDDAGVGVKNGINAYGKKNFIGAFSVPFAVLNDAAFLRTLSSRDWRSGFSEAVKVACLKDAAFFARLERDARRIDLRDEVAAAPVIRRSAELHLEHIIAGGDPFETHSARPLDFGHWSAHRLERMSNHEIRHGEAVAIGIALDVRYACAAGLLPHAARDRILSVLRDLGFSLSHPLLRETQSLMKGLGEFREHLGGRLTITLLREVGQGVDVHEVNANLLESCLAEMADGADLSAAS